MSAPESAYATLRELANLPTVEVYRDVAIRGPHGGRYLAAGWTAFTIEEARRRVDAELLLQEAKTEYAHWKAALEAGVAPKGTPFRDWCQKRGTAELFQAIARAA